MTVVTEAQFKTGYIDDVEQTQTMERKDRRQSSLEVLKWEERTCSISEYLRALCSTPGCQTADLLLLGWDVLFTM